MHRMVYILTDNNRKQWVFGVCRDISELSRNLTLQNQEMGLFPPVNRLVYLEQCDWRDDAFNRLETIRNFTPCQRERLIRQRNRNWKNLLSTSGELEESRQLSYAV